MRDFVIHDPATLPLLVQSFRKKSGMNQVEVARRLGIAQQTLSALERRADKAAADRLVDLLHVLGVEVVLRVRDSASTPAPAPTSTDGPVW